MLSKPSLVTRVAVGKLVGLAVGLLGLLLFPWLWPDLPWHMRFGFVCWYTTMGAMIGLCGVFKDHPWLKLPMPWWWRSFMVGAWMNFCLMLLLCTELETMLVELVGEESVWNAPAWFVVEGALVGLLIDGLATHFGGEGAETVAGDRGGSA